MDKPKNRIQPIVIDDLKKGLYTKQSKIDKLAKEIGVNKYNLRGFLRRKLKPGLKIAGRRFFSNVDEIAGFLREKSKENQLRIQKSKALGPRSKIIKLDAPIRDIPRLKHLAKLHDMRWRTVQNALDAGADPKSLLKTLSSETIDSHVIEEHLQKTFKKKNAARRALEKFRKSTKNKIVKTGNLSNRGSLRMFKAITEGVSKKEADAARRRLIKKSQKARMKTGHMRHWVPDYSGGKPKEPRLQKMSKSASNFQKMNMRKLLKMAKDSPEWKQITGKLKPISLEQQLKQFRSLDNSIKFQQGKYRGRHFSESQKMAKAYYDNLYKFNKTNETRNLQLQIKERGRLLHEINKKLKAGVKAPVIPKNLPKARNLLKVKNLRHLKHLKTFGAGLAIDHLSDKYVQPHTDALGRRIGLWMKPRLEELDRKIEKQFKKNETEE